VRSDKPRFSGPRAGSHHRPRPGASGSSPLDGVGDSAKLKLEAVLLLAVGVLAAGVGLAAHQALTANPPTPKHAEPLESSLKDPEEPAAAQDKQPRGNRADRHGDPLPSGAVARIGSTRWWHGRAPQECPSVFCPDGKTLACCDGKAVRFLDASSGKELTRVVPQDDDITRFALSPDGKIIVTASYKSSVLRIWDVAAGKEIRQIAERRGTSAVAFAPDGKTFAAGGAEDIRLWDVSTWQEKCRFAGHVGIHSIVFLPDGKTLISGGGHAPTIRWWNIDTGREIRRLDKVLDHSRLLALSPDGRRIAGVVAPGVLHIWDAVTGKEVNQTVLVKEPDYGIWSMSFSPDSRTLACSNAVGKRTRFFEADTGREVEHWDEERGVNGIAYSPNGKVLAQVTNNIIRPRDAKTGKTIGNWPGLEEYVLAVRFSPDGKTLTTICFGGGSASWEPLTGKQLRPLQGPPPGFAGRTAMLLAAAFTTDATSAALVDHKGVLHVWEAATGKALCRIDDPPVGPDQVDFSPDGKILVVRHKDRAVRIWDTKRGKLLHILPLNEGKTGRFFPHAHVFSSDGRFLATAPASDQDRTLRVWEAATGKEVKRFSWGDNTIPTCLTFSPDGKCVVAAHGAGGPEAAAADAVSVRFWELATGRERQRIKVPADDIRALAISPDGRTVAAALYDTVLLWEVVSGKECGRLVGHREKIWSLAFSPDGRLLASGSRDYTALVWDMTGAAK
jgi:WD40 repeat protein